MVTKKKPKQIVQTLGQLFSIDGKQELGWIR